MQLIVFFLILSVLVIIHEFGHFISAKIFGVRVEEFGFGLPPRAKKLFTKKGTDFTLNWLPIGGFVKLYGEEYLPGDSEMKIADRFYDKPMWQRAVILTAGVIMNFVLGVLLFAVVYSFLGIPTKTENVHIDEVMAGSPAEKVGLKKDEVVREFQVGDKISVVTNVDELVKEINENRGKEVILTVEGAGKSTRKVIVTPRQSPPPNEGALGVALTNVEMKKYPWYQMPFRGVVVGLKEAVAWGKDIAGSLWEMVVNIVKGKGVPKDLSGPIGIYQVSGQVIKFGVLAVLQFMGVLSVNLAILNIVPFPALDGGRLIFLAVEKVIGKKLKNRIEGYVNAGGMIFLLGMMLLITARDIFRIFANK